MGSTPPYDFSSQQQRRSLSPSTIRPPSLYPPSITRDSEAPAYNTVSHEIRDGIRYQAIAHLTEHDHADNTSNGLYSAITKRREDQVERSLSRQNNIDVRFSRGRTFLHFAAREGLKRTCRRLLESGSHINALDDNGFSALHYATANSRYEVAEFLIAEGADPCLLANGAFGVTAADCVEDSLLQDIPDGERTTLEEKTRLNAIISDLKKRDVKKRKIASDNPENPTQAPTMFLLFGVPL